jgi:hypothetical protein
MKFCVAIIFCFFLGKAFSEDSLSVVVSIPEQPVLPEDSLPLAINYDTSFADSAKIKPGLRFFVSIGVQFINFKERSEFQAHLNEQYKKYENDYLVDTLGTSPDMQNFETVNLTFPISAGIIWQFSDIHSLGLGVGFLYDNESVIITDKQGNTHNFNYTLQAFPAFAEYRLLISPNFISLKDNDYFSLFLRYYWLLPHTEINSSWGNAKADFNPLGNGYGVFLGYRFWELAGLSVFGEMGYVSLDAKASSKNAILNSWNLGGISLLIRAMF